MYPVAPIQEYFLKFPYTLLIHVYSKTVYTQNVTVSRNTVLKPDSHKNLDALYLHIFKVDILFTL